MKTCISTYSYSKLIKAGNFTHMDAIDQTKKFGMDAVEICVAPTAIPEGADYADYIKGLVDHAREIGLDVPILTLGADLYRRDPDEEYERLCKCIDVASACGIPRMRHDIASAFRGDEEAKTPDTIIKTIAPLIHKIASYAESKGVATCSENHGRIMQDSDRILDLFTAVNHKNYGLLCDMGNFGGADEDCARAVSRVLPLVRFVHAKDAFWRNGMMYDPGQGFGRTRGGHFRRATIFGHGDVPTFQILAALKNFGYDGYVSIEFEGIEDNLMALEIGSANLLRMLADLER